MIIIEDGDIVSQVFVAMLQRLLHLSFIVANVKEGGFDSLNIASDPGREEPDDKAQAEGAAQDQAVPYGLHQLERQ